MFYRKKIAAEKQKDIEEWHRTRVKKSRIEKVL